MSYSQAQQEPTHLQGPGAWGVRAILYPAIPPPWGAFEQGRPWVLWSKLLGTVRKQEAVGPGIRGVHVQASWEGEAWPRASVPAPHDQAGRPQRGC